ncbi:MAG TPA: hypothetical protein PLR86_07330, partial [Planctomycetota bacterium]|nr:hypothetical protein [Planctomycetota bacterium]
FLLRKNSKKSARISAEVFMLSSLKNLHESRQKSLYYILKKSARISTEMFMLYSARISTEVLMVSS